MSDEKIDHAAEALKHIDWAHDQQAAEGEFDYSVRDNALIAQVHATLALAEVTRELKEQQRLANRISMAALGSDPYTESRGYGELAAIREELGS